ncbi:hypothetical protein PLICRDRAFT_340318 [Plicaturopsis crispa FD-325 SS-3]|uniref:Uncharacterized protein n=1 Tax=Plicaturopsis crispa FD-325 SS-3 TaxID=944288 RepID=A0A0C9SY24_PLICR|nr:hypothetical protein PLICRDRAFT_340318 [Plicaturopsis crispa FD-325 SS-3]
MPAESKIGIALYELPATPDYFHWALVVVNSENGGFSGGVSVYQITNTRTATGQRWAPYHMSVSLENSVRFIGIVQIGRVPWGTSEFSEWIDTMPVEDANFPPAGYGWSCAWYILSIIDALHLSLVDTQGLPDSPLLLYHQVRQCGMVLNIMRRSISLPIVRLDGSRVLRTHSFEFYMAIHRQSWSVLITSVILSMSDVE